MFCLLNNLFFYYENLLRNYEGTLTYQTNRLENLLFINCFRITTSEHFTIENNSIIWLAKMYLDRNPNTESNHFFKSYVICQRTLLRIRVNKQRWLIKTATFTF